MDIVTMLVTMIAVALGSLALGLCILYSTRTKTPWSKLLVAFLSVLVGAMTLIALEHYTSFSLSIFGKQHIADTLSLIFECIVCVCVSFLILFLPFFISLVLGKLHHQKLFWLGFSILAAVYLAAGIIRQFVTSNWLFYVQACIFMGDYFFCMIVLWANVSKIKAPDTRRTIVAGNIVSLCLLPVFILTMFFPQFLMCSYGIYYMAFAILMIVFFYGYFDEDFKDRLQPRELQLDDLKEYHISEREFSVIQLISQGMTNKEIGSQLNISVNTVNNHVANVFSKTGVRSRIDLLNLLKEVIKK